MKIVKINNKNPQKTVIQKAAEVLMSGGTVVYPTDTAYGLGVNASNTEAVEKLYRLKGRDFNKPTHVVVRDWEMIQDITFPNENAKKLFDKFMPGPITLILPKRNVVSEKITAGLPTLGVRIPDSKVTQLVAKRVNFPFTTPSANRAGGKTPYKLEDVINELDTEKVDLILDAGELPEKLPSTLVDLTGDVPKVLRVGPISESSILEALV